MIGVQVFGKEDSFDPRTDPIVRVQARRLRAKLVRYYREEGRADELIIELPKGGYAPVFKRRETPVLVKRSIGAALVSRNTIAVLPFADHSAAQISITSAGACATKSCTISTRLPILAHARVGRADERRRQDRAAR